MEKKKSKRIVIISLAALLVAVGVFLAVYLLNRPETSAGAKSYTVTVVHKNSESKDFSYNTDEEYLGAALKAEGLISGSESEYGLMIEIVDGERAVWAQDGAYWAFYIGGEYAQTGVDSTPVHDGDRFRLEYTLAS